MGVFISYSSIDCDKAKLIKDRFEKNGVLCWKAPESIPTGSNYGFEIPKAIKSCEAFVLLLSLNAQESAWVPKELDFAISAKKAVFPIKIEDCGLRDDFEFALINVQVFDRVIKTGLEPMEDIIGEIKTYCDSIEKYIDEMNNEAELIKGMSRL